MGSRNAHLDIDTIASYAAFFVPFAAYVYSMQRFVGFWDVGEMQTVPYILGIAHPTGFPAFILLGWLFSHVFIVGSVAWRMTLLCVLAMSGAAWLTYKIVLSEEGEALIALLCAWIFAFTDIAWRNGTRTDVHAVAALFIALTLYCALRWSRTQNTRWLFFGSVAWALAVATHPVAVLLGVGIFALVVYRWETVSLGALAAAGTIFVILICAFYAYLPLRSAQVFAERRDPTLALGIAPGRPFWDYDHPSRAAGFTHLVSGSEFPVGDALAQALLPETYVSHGGRYTGALIENLTLAGVVLTLMGGFVFVRREKLRAIGFLLCGLFAAPFALSFPIEADIDRYFLPSFLVAGALIGVGACALCRRWPLIRAGVIASLFIVAGAQFALHAELLGQRNDPGATNYIEFVRTHTPPNAILMAPWTFATPLAYAAYVEHRLDRRVVETAWLSDDIEQFPKWVRTRPVYIVYLPWGDLPKGYRLDQLAGSDPPVYRVLKAR
ncbi:MAG: protein O-mannosyl-transferase family [Candidatus Baltobacteraceae bacterium]